MKKYVVFPGLTLAPAHLVPATVVQSKVSIFDPSGNAANSATALQFGTPVDETDGLLVDEALELALALELVLVGLADEGLALAELEPPDEQLATATTTSPAADATNKDLLGLALVNT